MVSGVERTKDSKANDDKGRDGKGSQEDDKSGAVERKAGLERGAAKEDDGMDTHAHADKDRVDDRENDRARDRERGRERNRERERERSRSRDKDRRRDSERDKQKDRIGEGDRDIQKGKEVDKSRERERESDRGREKERERDADREGDRDKGRERERERLPMQPSQQEHGDLRDGERERKISEHSRGAQDERREPGATIPGVSARGRRGFISDRRLGPLGRSGPNRRINTVLLKPKPDIDREKTCPLLLRMFCKLDGHHSVDDYQKGNVPVEDELTMHTWLDASFRELTALIREVTDEAKPRGTQFEFSAVYPTQRGAIVMKEIATVVAGHKADSDLVCLGQTRFKIGDYIDVAIRPPQASGIFGPGTFRERHELRHEQ